MRYFKLTCMLILLICLSCSKGTMEPDNSQTQLYSYKAFDSNRTLIIEGLLWFNISTSDLLEDENYLPITGEWHFTQIGNPENIGNQVGQGKLTGAIEGDQIWINLNPGWADDNVYLNGKLDSNIFTGDWIYATFVGTVNGGTFKSVKL